MIGEDLDPHRIEPSQPLQHSDKAIPRPVVPLPTIGAWFESKEGNIRSLQRCSVSLQEPPRWSLPSSVTQRCADDDCVVTVKAGDTGAAFQIDGDATEPEVICDFCRHMASGLLLGGTHDEAVLHHLSGGLLPPSLLRRGGWVKGRMAR